MIYLRPLVVEDAKTSWRWRNDEEVWKLTGSKPAGNITEEIETKWLESALKRNTELRFAICLKETDEYIGNAQFTDVCDFGAQIHIFIGEKAYWGKGIGKLGSARLVEIADEELSLPVTYITVRPEHVAVRKIYASLGFVEIGLVKEGHLLMERKRFRTQPLVSVFMMSYNHGKFIAAALDGVFRQEVGFSFEIVLGDDKSPDNTREIIYEYYRKRPDLFKLLLHSENLGAVKNQWTVFDACTGEYIAMLEGDDYWTHPHKLQQQVSYLQQHPEVAICFHNAAIVNEEGQQEGLTNLPDQPTMTQFEDLAQGEYIYTATCVFRASYLRWFPLAGRRYMNNYTLDLFNAQFGSIYYFNEVWSVYRKHSGGAWSMKPRLNTLRSQLPTYEYYLQLFGHRSMPMFLQHVRNITSEMMRLLGDVKDRSVKRDVIKSYVKYHGGWRRNKRLLIRYLS
jgi:glycosyltransferase involved in cell wall biosynthesis/RimJ/RimL family protein N-acetyltransferase